MVVTYLPFLRPFAGPTSAPTPSIPRPPRPSILPRWVHS